MRPQAIVNFERLFLASILLSVVPLALIASEEGALAEMIVGIGLMLLSVALVLLASRRRSNVARWVLAILTAIGLAATGYEIGRVLGANEALSGVALIDLIAVALQTAAVAMLFMPGAREWFARREETPVDEGEAREG